MVGRLLRVTGTVLVIAVAFVTPVLATSAPASADTVIDGCTIVANPTATDFTNCPGVSFAGADLSGVNLSFANLSGAAFADVGTCLTATCEAVDLSGANLTDANLSSATFFSSGLYEYNPPPNGGTCVGAAAAMCYEPVSGAASLVNANLTDANFSSANLTDTFLSGADFTGATLAGANVTGTGLVPGDQTLNGPTAGLVVSWPAPTGLPGATPGTCTQASGSTFPSGTTTVTCQVLDDHGNVATGTFTVTITQVSIYADGLSSSASLATVAVGTPVTFTDIIDIDSPNDPGSQGTVTFTDNGSPIAGCAALPLEETFFSSGVGTFSVTCTATIETSGVHQIGAPYSDPGGDIQNYNPAAFQEIVTPTACATLSGCDLAGLDLSGAGFTGDDLSGANLSGADLTDTILDGADLTGADLTGTDLTGASIFSTNFTGTVLAPQDQTVTATSSAGAVVTWPTPAGLPGATPGTCTPASGSTFPVGLTTVTCQVQDDFGGTPGVASFTVTVNRPSPPTTFVGIPSNGATVTGDSWLDAGASSPVGIASVTFEVSGGPNSISDQVVGTGAPTVYGYIGAWNSSSVPNGTYTIQSVATDTTGVSTTSAPITITVNNPPPSTTVISPASGATIDATQGYVLDAAASAGATAVTFEVSFVSGTFPYTATPTIYGWIAVVPPTQSSGLGTISVADSIVSTATYAGGVTVTSPAVTGTIKIPNGI